MIILNAFGFALLLAVFGANGAEVKKKTAAFVLGIALFVLQALLCR